MVVVIVASPGRLEPARRRTMTNSRRFADLTTRPLCPDQIRPERCSTQLPLSLLAHAWLSLTTFSHSIVGAPRRSGKAAVSSALASKVALSDICVKWKRPTHPTFIFARSSAKLCMAFERKKSAAAGGRAPQQTLSEGTHAF